MDQLRKVWDWLQRHHFWVLIVVAVAIALGCWWRGANALYAEFSTNKSKIENEFSSTQRVRNAEFHANDDIQQKQNEEIARQHETVNALWKQLYERQTDAVLKWPGNLSQEFRDYIQRLKFGETIPINLRRQYNNYIQDHFPELPKIVGALEAAEGDSGGYSRGGGGSFDPRSLIEGQRGGSGVGYGDTAGQVEEPEYIVIWSDQGLIRDELAPRETPSSKRIWKTQEDLWVYEALLTIIANTNEAAGADRFSNAAVRVIESLEVGRLAAQASRGRSRIDSVAGPGGGAPGFDGYGGDQGMMGGGGEPGGGMDRGGEMMGGMYGGEADRGGMDSTSADAALFNNRYVNETGAPIASSGEGGPEEFGKEFKRLPVRMQLWMDQRWLPQLVAECANAPLQVEVQEVRINPSDSSDRGGYGGYGGRGGGMSGSQAEEMTPDPFPNMKTVVIQGIVYIFNPPTEEAADATLAAQ